MTFSHEQVVVVRGTASELPVIVAIHSTALGPALGGCRLWNYPSWQDGLVDALRLSEAMTLKAAVAGLPHGGGKSVIVLPPGAALDAERRRAVMLDLGDVVDALGGRYGVGEDVGTTAADMAVARQRTRWAYCLPSSDGGVGDPSQATARGVLAAIRATCDHLYGTPQLGGRRVTVLGLGQVGGRVAAKLAEDGGELLVSDVDEAKKEFADRLGVDWSAPEDALFAPTDVLVPAALGGLFTAERVSRLRCAAIVGPANNQLAEPVVGELLHEVGVLWAPDFVVNAGGLIFGAVVDVAQQPVREAWPRIDAIGETLRSIYLKAAQDGSSPATTASELARSRLREGIARG